MAQDKEVPGFNVPPQDPEFEAKVARNSWHDVRELPLFIETVQKLAKEDDFKEDRWSWVRNTECKYVDIRIDMRDGGFVFKDRSGNRINLEQLKWQYKTPTE